MKRTVLTQMIEYNFSIPHAETNYLLGQLKQLMMTKTTNQVCLTVNHHCNWRNHHHQDEPGIQYQLLSVNWIVTWMVYIGKVAWLDR